MSAIINTGLAYIASQQAASEAVQITQFVLANIDGLDPTQAVNPNEVIPPWPETEWIDSVTQTGYLSENKVVYSLQLDSTIGDFSFNWMGLLGHDGTLVAVSYLPLVLKTRTEDGVSGNNITRNFILQFESALLSTGITIDASTWQFNFNERLVGIDDRERLSNLDFFGRQTFINEGFELDETAGTYQILSGIAWIAGIQINALDNLVVTDINNSQIVYIDVAMINNGGDLIAEYSIYSNAVVQNDYMDGAGIQHYVEPIASLDGSGIITDLRKILLVETSIADLINQISGDVANHSHTFDDVENLEGSLDSIRLNQGQLQNQISEKADANHNHDDDYAPNSHNHDSVYAGTNHNHDTVYARADHNHDSQYSSSSHHHDLVYAKLEDIENLVFAENKALNGYTKLPNGIIIQWGEAVLGNSGTSRYITLPISFEEQCTYANAIVSPIVEESNVSATVTLNAPSLATILLRSSGSQSYTFKWFAIGY